MPALFKPQHVFKILGGAVPLSKPRALSPHQYEETLQVIPPHFVKAQMEAVALAFATVQAFDSCIRAYQFISVANSIKRDGSQILSRLQWEHYRLIQWGKRAELDSHPPSNRLNWGYATILLKEQVALLTSAEKLKAKYHLDVTEERLSEVLMEERTRLDESRFTKYLKRLRPDFAASRTPTIQGKNETFNRLRWATVGKEQADRIVRDISELNDRLHYLLDSTDRDWIRESLSELLRDLISECADVREIETIQSLLHPESISSDHALATVAQLKQIRLVLGASKRASDKFPNPSGTEVPSLRQLRHERLSPRPPSPFLKCVGMEVARYDGQDVLVEWKIAEGWLWGVVKKHVQRLGLLLSKMDDPSFHTLPWLGLLPWEEKGRFGFVYDIPIKNQHQDGSWRHETLYMILQDSPMVSLSRRIEIAIELTETVLQLHTAGWLHKGIRSENIIFVAPYDGGSQLLILGKTFLSGFEYARPNSKAGKALTELPDTPLLTDLYRHPGARGIHRQSFQKRFDMYALGCVLLELALWKPLMDIFSISHEKELVEIVRNAEAQGSELQLPSLLGLANAGELFMHVTHSAGNAFWEAIHHCFAEGIEGENISVEAEKKVLKILQRKEA